MNKKFIIVTMIILSAVFTIFILTKSAGDGKEALVSPAKKIFSRSTPAPASTPFPIPQTPSYNPPTEIHYNSATDLKQELETINPEVLESDFAE